MYKRRRGTPIRQALSMFGVRKIYASCLLMHNVTAVTRKHTQRWIGAYNIAITQRSTRAKVEYCACTHPRTRYFVLTIHIYITCVYAWMLYESLCKYMSTLSRMVYVLNILHDFSSSFYEHTFQQNTRQNVDSLLLCMIFGNEKNIYNVRGPALETQSKPTKI